MLKSNSLDLFRTLFSVSFIKNYNKQLTNLQYNQRLNRLFTQLKMSLIIFFTKALKHNYYKRNMNKK